MPLSFAEASFITGLIAGIDPSKGATFESRLKQWQKKGFPEGTQVGKGQRAEYGATQVFQLALMAKLLKVGLTPDRAQHVILAGWPAFKDGIVETLLCQANDADHLHYFMVQLDALSDLTSPDSDHEHVFIEILTDDEMAEAWAPSEEIESEEEGERYAYFRFLVKNRMALSITIEIDSLLLWVWAAFAAREIDPSIFADELATWESERRERGRSHQGDQEAINSDLSRRSLEASNAVGVDRVEAARAALSKVKNSGNS
ncbi:hypothetical protein QQS45_07470 [Alteriqipengyuania flavescens]|uniref:MerR family transcriptional regulator n=1 Tax=Alteriqipengyuania flavescens TaxID=3053610 RepID=UPI0025B3156B|nr:MerR family transcriptional regulator [Alteriqipengyuania flavescens]WJY17505.1 hypothetical protein QQW98_07460 [Alteriqipengyuania flavescens]WJY23448.1 hypothetical protein QQS45_07470 [Alteriqipengyuania flavescens]